MNAQSLFTKVKRLSPIHLQYRIKLVCLTVSAWHFHIIDMQQHMVACAWKKVKSRKHNMHNINRTADHTSETL